MIKDQESTKSQLNIAYCLRENAQRSPHDIALEFPARSSALTPKTIVVTGCCVLALSFFLISKTDHHLSLLKITGQVVTTVLLLAIPFVLYRFFVKSDEGATFRNQHQEFTRVTFEQLEQMSNVSLFSHVQDQSKLRAIMLVSPYGQTHLLMSLAFSCLKNGLPIVVLSPFEFPSLSDYVHCVSHSNANAIIATPITYIVFCLIMWWYRSPEQPVLAIEHLALVSESKVFNSLIKPFQKAQWKHLPNNSALHHYNDRDTVALINTTGSTGVPKLCHITHGMLRHQLGSFSKLLSEHYKLFDRDENAPENHICMNHNIVMSICVICLNIRAVMPPRFPKDSPARVNCQEWLSCMNQLQPTIVFASTIVWYVILDYCVKHDLKLPPSVRIVIAGGAPIPIELHRKLRRISSKAYLYPTYGSTECLPIAYINTEQIERDCNFGEKDSQVSGVCLGRICEGIELSLRPIVPFDINDKEMPIRKIWLKGPAVSPKYEYNTTDSAEKKDLEWHDTGDLGYLDSNSYLRFCGRMKHSFFLTIPNSQNEHLFVAPVCIEHFFMQHCASWLRRCALIGFNAQQLPEHHGLNQCRKAILVLETYKEARRMTIQDIQQELTHILTNYGSQIAYYSPHLIINHNLLFVTTWNKQVTDCNDGYLPCDPRHNSKIERIKLKAIFENCNPSLVIQNF